MEAFGTLPSMLRYVTATYHNAQAMCHREGDRWSYTSSESFAGQVRRMALGLVVLGLKPGQSVGILAESSPWWLVTDLAIMTAGGVSVPLFPHTAERNLKFKIRDADIRLVFVSDHASASRFRLYRRLFSKVIVFGQGPSRGSVIGSDALGRMGDNLSAKQPTLYCRMTDQAQRDDIATIVYTSGTMGVPKGVRMTHRNLVTQIQAAARRFELGCDNDRALSVLPLAHIFERMVVYFYISRGVSVWFADHSGHLVSLIGQVRPTCMAVVPRVLEKMYASMVSNAEAASFFRRPLARWALRTSPMESSGTRLRRWRDRLTHRVVSSKIKQTLGGRLRIVICGGATLAPRLCEFFCQIGVPTYQGYGLTEASPVICTNYPGHHRIGTVGLPFPGVEVVIGEGGEILARGPNVMAGYHNNRLASEDAVDADGYLHTGDLGRIDADGYLTITGRIKELYKTAGGKCVCPAPIEIALTASPFIDQAYVVADGKAYTSCLLFPDTDQIRRILGTPDRDQVPDDQLLDMPHLNRQIQALVADVNQSLAPWEQIKEYRLVTDSLSVENGGLTPTQKPQRHFLDQQYRALIDSMYDGNGVQS